MNALRTYPVRLSNPGWLILSILPILIVGAAPVRADECVTHYTTTFPFCGIFQGSSCHSELWTEDTSGCLKHFLRFENLPPRGTHRLRMGLTLQDLFLGSPTPETVDFTAYQQTGCDGTGTGSLIVTCDENGCQPVTDYALGMSGSTDICVGIESNNLNPVQGTPPDQTGREEVLMEDNGDTSTCAFRPVIVTDPVEEALAASDYCTSPGTIVSGTSYVNTQTSNDVRENLREALVNNKAKLKHIWRFDNVPAGSSHELLIEGYRPNSPGGDNFEFGFSQSVTTCSSPFQIITNAVISSPTESSTNYPFGDGAMNGTIYIGVWDTVPTDTSQTNLYIDKLVIRTIFDCP